MSTRSTSDEDEKQHDPNYVDWRNMQNIHVVCRFRPINHRERREERHAKLTDIPPTTTNHGQCVNIHRHSHDSIKHGSSPLRFHLDRVLPSATSQKAMYKIAAKPMVDACLAGYNATVLAYGQTGSGKTYTMFGPKKPKKPKSDQIGCVQRSLSYLFAQLNRRKKKKRVTEWKVLLHFVQLYREQWMDLLEPAHADKKHIRFDPVSNSPYVPNLKSVDVRDMDEVNAFLAVARQNRVTEKTPINAASSRSHMIMTLQMEQTLCDGTLKKSKLHFADLADSESYDHSDANQKKMAEMANINLSLTNLTTCINYLSKGRKASHRSAQLTFYLMDSLGGNSKTTLAVLASPHICNRNETIRALRFAKTAKTVRNKAKVNTAMSRAKLMALVKKLQRENKQLKARLALFDEHGAVDKHKKSSLRTRGRSKSMQSLTRTEATPRLEKQQRRKSVDLQTSVADNIHFVEQRSVHSVVDECAYKALKAQLKAVEAELRSQEEESNALRREIGGNNKELDGLTKELQAAKNMNNMLVTKSNWMDLDECAYNELKVQLKLCEADLCSQEEETNALRRELGKYNKKMDGLRKELQAAKNMNNSLVEKSNWMDLDDKVLEESRLMLVKESISISRSRATVVNVKKKECICSTVSFKIKSLSSQLNALRDSERVLRTQLQCKNVELEDLQSVFEAERKELTAKIVQLADELHGFKSNVRHYEGIMDSMFAAALQLPFLIQ